MISRYASTMSMLDPRRLRLLVELADRGTIVAVAESLHFAASTVSHGLSTLERDVGVALFERGARSVRLTPAGHALTADARTILASLTAAEADARAIGRLDRGELTVAVFASAGATFVADAVGRLARRRDGPSIRVVDAEPAESLARLASGEVDMAVVYDYPYLPKPDLTGLVSVALSDDPIHVCLPPRYPADADRPVSLHRLRDESFIAGRAGSACHLFVRALCAGAGFDPRIDFETDNIAFTCALVDAGIGIAIMPQLLIGTASRTVRTLELDPAVAPRRISVVHRAYAAGLPSITAALDALDASSRRAAAQSSSRTTR